MQGQGPTSRPKVFVGIPAHNEERAIASVVTGALPHAAAVIVVDDGSADLTSFRARAAGAVVIRHRRNHGKGAAVATVFDYAVRNGADALVLLDGDGQHDASEIPALLAPVLAAEADLVVGSRFLSVKSDVPLHRTVGQRAFNVMTALASGVPCSDSQSGFRAYSRRALGAMRLTEASFSVECEQQFECLLHGLRLAEVPIRCSYDRPAKRSAYRQGLNILGRLGAMALRRRMLGQKPAAVTASATPAAMPDEEAHEPVVAMAAD